MITHIVSDWLFSPCCVEHQDEFIFERVAVAYSRDYNEVGRAQIKSIADAYQPTGFSRRVYKHCAISSRLSAKPYRDHAQIVEKLCNYPAVSVASAQKWYGDRTEITRRPRCCAIVMKFLAFLYQKCATSHFCLCFRLLSFHSVGAEGYSD